MKLATFIDPTNVNGARLGVIRAGGLVDVPAAADALHRAIPATSVKAALCSGPATIAALKDLAEAAEKRGLLKPIDKLRFLPPVIDPPKFFCVGKNTMKHREELVANDLLKEVPTEPTGFIKLASTMCGQDAEIVRPAGISTLDYEPELVFVISKRAFNVKKADAYDYVGGFTLFNDVTAREIQKREVASGTRFWTAKNMPNFAPIGPFVATFDEVADVNDLWLTCAVNGQPRLRENTGKFIYTIADVLEHFTRYMPFEPGDLIAMGAPSGVAFGQPNAAELFLKPGDRMEIGIEGVMSLRSTIIAPDA